VLHVTEQLREVGVVDRFVEFFGPGVSNLTVPDRATIANMAPEQGSTISMFGVDEATLDYLELTGRDEEHIELVREYFDAQGLFGEQNPEYSETVEFDLSTITPSLAGPKKPQDRVAMGDMKTHFRGLVHGEFEEELDDIDEEAITRWLGESSASDDRPDPDLPEPDVGDLDKRVAVDVNSEGRSPSGSLAEPGDGETTEIGHGSVVVSAITSCTNTSNPSVMIAAGLLARNAVERGLDDPRVRQDESRARKPRRHRISRSVGASPVPRRPRLQRRRLRLYDLYRERRPLPEPIERAIDAEDLWTTSVLSGNRNFEARIHPKIRANYLASPPLVVAYGLAGRMDIDLEHDPLGTDADGDPVYLADIWPDADGSTRRFTTVSIPRCSKRSTPPCSRETNAGRHSMRRPVRSTSGTTLRRTSASRPFFRTSRWKSPVSQISTTPAR